MNPDASIDPSFHSGNETTRCHAASATGSKSKTRARRPVTRGSGPAWGHRLAGLITSSLGGHAMDDKENPAVEKSADKVNEAVEEITIRAADPTIGVQINFDVPAALRKWPSRA